jgi:hypothetical protein
VRKVCFANPNIRKKSIDPLLVDGPITIYSLFLDNNCGNTNFTLKQRHTRHAGIKY